MPSTPQQELYQQVILEHNSKPRNFKKLENPTHFAEGYNPLCGDHLTVYMIVGSDGVINEASFQGDGCAISRAAASMMTVSLKGKTTAQAEALFKEFHQLVTGQLKPQGPGHSLNKLVIFSGIWQYPTRVKCATLAWHAMHGALHKTESVSTENE